MTCTRRTGRDGELPEARGVGRLASGARALLLAAWVCACGPPDPLAPRPRASVVLISIDTLRADHLGCYGYARPTSPHLDEFARGAVLFERALSASNNTAPSHMSLLSGVSPAVHGLEHRELRAPPTSIPMLAEILHEAGYRTLGMADGGFVTPELGFARGFDTFESRLQPFKHKLPGLLEWIARGCAEPTFLFVHTYDVHSPYVPPVDFDRFTDPDYQGPFRARLDKFREAFEKPELVYTMGALHSNFWEDDMDHLTPSDLTYLAALYDGEISEVDARLGLVFAELQRNGWYDDSWIIIVSDHGEAFGEHGSTTHRQLFQEELHVPLLIRPPGGLPATRRVAGTLPMLDLAPTILWAVGLPAPPSMEGKSLLPSRRGGETPVLSLAGESKAWRSLVLGEQQVIVKANRPPAAFDLSADPGERVDLVIDGKPPAWAEALLKQLQQLDADAARRRALLQVDAESHAPAAELSPDALEELKALGYVH